MIKFRGLKSVTKKMPVHLANLIRTKKPYGECDW